MKGESRRSGVRAPLRAVTMTRPASRPAPRGNGQDFNRSCLAGQCRQNRAQPVGALDQGDLAAGGAGGADRR